MDHSDCAKTERKKARAADVPEKIAPAAVTGERIIRMKITVLCENTTCSRSIGAEHGLSLYIRTERHKLLFDMGQSDLFLKNAQALGIDLAEVDIAVVSHGHYDHGGGLGAFLDINKKAPVYISKHAFGEHYNGEGKYIGLDPLLLDSTRLIPVDDYLRIDGELELFSCNERERKYGTDPFGLGIKKDGNIIPDEFLHEQYLCISENGKRTVISGCSHKGIFNIMGWFLPDVLVGGFHFMKLDPMSDGEGNLTKAAELLMRYPAEYYTGHCTGETQFTFLKGFMGDKLHYISSGNTVTV